MGTYSKKLKNSAAWLKLSKPAFETENRRGCRTYSARIDSGKQTIIGVNKYRLEKEDPIDILEVDNTAVRKQQIARLNELKANRDEAAVKLHWKLLQNA